MNRDLLKILEQIRLVYLSKNLANFSFREISKKTGISMQELKAYFLNESDLVGKFLEFERHGFQEIFEMHDFEGVNAIDILLTVSREVATKYYQVTPSVSVGIKDKYPEIYQIHIDKRIEFIFDKIKINLQKGISQGMYREDLSIELVARLYISRLIDIHNPAFFPPHQFSFETLFEFMFENFVYSVGKPEGIAYFQKKKKCLKMNPKN